ncbi:MAG: DUF2461 domain-containing protein [Acidimicrobiales bacterium]
MAFRGWPAEAFEFFEGLEADNTKTFWQAHEAAYKADVRGPMEELLAELAPEFGEGKLSRPYRDLRFSPNKAPYKTQIYAVLGGVGYVGLSATGLSTGRGYYMMDAAQLERYRHAVVDDALGADLAGVVAATEKKGLEVASFESLKTAPRGYPKDHPRADLLRRKGLFAWKSWEPAPWMGTKAAKTRIVKVLHDAEPLHRWLDANVG